ncbi:MAG: heme-binding protein [Deltaproteobacteria bacterium]|nr:heme-binding protein [Deltaproteobacteria bacterium]
MNLVRRESAPSRFRSAAALLAMILWLAPSPDALALKNLVTAPLTVTDVQNVIARAVTQAVQNNQAVTIAISDREGNVLGVFIMTGAPINATDADEINLNPAQLPDGALASTTAIEKARTAAFLSSDQNAFSTRTGGFIVMPHFPPNVADQPQGPLFQLQFSQLPCGDVQEHGNGIIGDPGGIPLYKNKQIAGGIGVDGASTDEDEIIALAGTSGPYSVPQSITADNILLGGVRLLYVAQPLGKHFKPEPFASLPGMVDPTHPIVPTPPTSFPLVTIGGASGELRFPIIDSPMPGPTKLLASDVSTIMTNSIRQALNTRAAIRLPIGVPARMQVGVTDVDGNILGLFRTNDATMFSMDIVIQKARSVSVFSDPTQTLGQEIRQDLGVPVTSQIAFTTRTLGFLAQPFYPPGIDGTSPGPLNEIQQMLYSAHPTKPCEPNGNGVTLFPGSAPLYKDGVLVGGVGLSGDGVDQDDFITAGGTPGYEPSDSIEADQITFRGTPLPYLKFPRHPTLH